MNKIAREEIVSNQDYLKKRDQFRQQVLEIKDKRRIYVGSYLNFLFENRNTMIYQIQEMMRAEGINDDRAIQHEIDTYNQLVPDKKELKATLLIEFDDPAVRKVKLVELVGLQEQINIVIAEKYEVPAVFDQKQIESAKLSSVQYLTFSFTDEAAEAFMNENQVELVTSHSACSFRQLLTKTQLAALREDLEI